MGAHLAHNLADYYGVLSDEVMILSSGTLVEATESVNTPCLASLVGVVPTEAFRTSMVSRTHQSHYTYGATNLSNAKRGHETREA